jgi:hypothetical protein
VAKGPEKAISRCFHGRTGSNGPISQKLVEEKGAKYPGRKILRSGGNGLGTLKSIGIDGIAGYRSISLMVRTRSSSYDRLLYKKNLLAKKAPKYVIWSSVKLSPTT